MLRAAEVIARLSAEPAPDRGLRSPLRTTYQRDRISPELLRLGDNSDPGLSVVVGSGAAGIGGISGVVRMRF